MVDTLPRSVRKKAKKVEEAYLILGQRNNRMASDPQKELDSTTKKILAETIDHSTEKEGLIVALYYYEELSITEIAEIMSLSPSGK